MAEIEILLDNIAKKHYGEKYRYCTKAEQLDCIRHLDHHLKLEREQREVKEHITKSLNIGLVLLLVFAFIMMINSCF